MITHFGSKAADAQRIGPLDLQCLEGIVFIARKGDTFHVFSGPDYRHGWAVSIPMSEAGEMRPVLEGLLEQPTWPHILSLVLMLVSDAISHIFRGGQTGQEKDAETLFRMVGELLQRTFEVLLANADGNETA